MQLLSCTHDADFIYISCLNNDHASFAGMSVLELQKKLPNARVVYSSATGATEPKNMAYMTRLGLWGKGTTFNDFNDFIQVWMVRVCS